MQPQPVETKPAATVSIAMALDWESQRVKNEQRNYRRAAAAFKAYCDVEMKIFTKDHVNGEVIKIVEGVLDNLEQRWNKHVARLYDSKEDCLELENLEEKSGQV